MYMYIALRYYIVARVFAQNFATLCMNLVTYARRLVVRVNITVTKPGIC